VKFFYLMEMTMKSVFCLLAVLAATGAQAAVRPLSAAEMNAATAGYNSTGACVDNGPCGRARNYQAGCADDETYGDDGYHSCTDVKLCAAVDTPGSDNITCTGNLGVGCLGGSVYCGQSVLSWCQTNHKALLGGCDCNALPAIGFGSRDTCDSNDVVGGQG
jgi:hypothetical protein